MTADAVGGVWQYAADLSRALTDTGHEVVIAVVGPDADRQATPADGLRVIATGLPLDWLCDDAAPVLDAGRALARLVGEVGADLVHCNHPSLLAAAPMGVPTIAVAHGCIGTWSGGEVPATYRWLDALIGEGLRAADVAVAPSASHAAATARHHRLNQVPTAIHNGRAHRALPDAPQAVGVFTAGRLWDPVKNTAVIDRVAGKLPVSFEAAGDLSGPHGETARPDHLVTLGRLDDAAVAARLAARPIFVSAARFEPFGLAVLEAAQAGCPLILSGIDTFRELWTGAALFVADPDDADGYLLAIEQVLADDGKRQHLGEAARVCAARYTPEAMATAMVEVYAGLIAPAEPLAA